MIENLRKRKQTDRKDFLIIWIMARNRTQIQTFEKISYERGFRRERLAQSEVAP